MVDIAASLSLTSTGSALDPSAILGLETADMQAFGDILAGKVGAGDAAPPAAAAPANPFAALTLPAGNRQPGGKILPDAAAVLPQLAGLPEAASVDAGAPTAPVASVAAAHAPVTAKLVASLARSAEAPAAPEIETANPEPAKQAEASPVHGLIKMLTAALKGQRPAAEDKSADAPAKLESAVEETPIVEAPAPIATIPATAIVQVQAALTLPAAAAPGAPASASAPRARSEAPVLPGAHAAPRAAEHAAARSAVQAALQSSAQPAVQSAAQPAALQQAVLLPTVQGAARPVTQDAAPVAPEAPRAPVLTVAATPAEAPAAAVSLLAKPALPPAARGVTARIKLAPAEADNGQVPVANQAAPSLLPPVAEVVQVAVAEPQTAAALRSAAAERAAPLADGAISEVAAAPVLPVAGGAAQAAASAVPGIAPTTSAELPRQDFAALVERLVEARNAGAAQSTHASVHHAEFGQVSLKFQQDGGDLSVSMSSADPDFAIAAQAAMPTDRQAFNSNADAQPRQNPGQQSQSQTSTQANAHSSNSHHEASAQRDAAGSDPHGRGHRGGRQPDRNDNSNRSPRWSERDQPQTRGGIFA